MTGREIVVRWTLERRAPIETRESFEELANLIDEELAYREEQIRSLMAPVEDLKPTT